MRFHVIPIIQWVGALSGFLKICEMKLNKCTLHSRAPRTIPLHQFRSRSSGSGRNVGAVWKKFCILLCEESQRNINSCFWDLSDKEAQLLLSSAMFQRHMTSTQQLVY